MHETRRTDAHVAGQPRHRTLYSYVAALVDYARWKLAGTLCLLMLVGLTEGGGLLLLIPFLHLIGLSQAGETPTGLVAAVARVFKAVGVPLTLPAILGVFIALVTLHAVLLRQREVLLAEIRLGFVDHLRTRLYTAIGHANWLFLSRTRASDLTHVLTSDIMRVGLGTYAVLQVIVAGFMALVHIVVAFRLSAFTTAVALSTGGGLLLVLWPQVRRAKQLGVTLTEANRGMFGTVSDFLDGIKLAKSYGAEERYCDAFRQAVITLRRQLLGFTCSNATLRMLYQIGAAVVLSGLLYIAAVVVQLPTANLLVLVLVFARLLPLLSHMQQNYQHLVHMLPAFAEAMQTEARCVAAAECPSPGDDGVPTLDLEIRLRDVHFRYDQQADREVLAGINLAVQARRTTALVGPSGAGKSTLADLLLGLLRPDSGEILIDGEPLGAECTPLWRRRVAYVPQETFLFHDTVRANLLWTQPQACDADLWRVLQLVAADAFVAGLPDGLDTVVGDRGIRLSGGERQRIALARALLCQPALLILDEATSALDTEHERRIQQAIEALHGELTMVVIAHRLSTVRRADQIVVIDGGRVIETGSWNALSAHAGGRLQALLQAGTVDMQTYKG